MDENKRPSKPTIGNSKPGNDASKYNAEVPAEKVKKENKKPPILPEYEGLSDEEIKEREREAKKEWKGKRRTRRALKSYHGRKVKNFIFWLTGFLCAIAIFAIVTVVGGKVVPLKTFIGEDDKVVSSNVYNKSAIDAVMNIRDYTLDDVPIVKDNLLKITENETIKKFVTVDEKRLGTVKLVNIGSELMDCFNFDIDNIKVSSFIDINSENQKIYDMLIDGIGGGKTAEELRIGDLKNFDDETIKLSTFLPISENEKTYDILVDGIGRTKTAENFTVGDIKSFNIDNVTIDAVLKGIDIGDNAILKAILNKDITLGNMATEIDKLYIADIYNVVCFTKDVSKRQEDSWTYKYKYNEADKSYTLAADGEYYISNEASVWLFVAYKYDSSNLNSEGRAMKYEFSGLTFGSMKSKMIDTVNGTIQNATVRQLVDAGMLPGGYSSSIYKVSISYVLEHALVPTP